MQKCRWCGFEFDDGLEKCPECGTKVKRHHDAADYGDDFELKKLTTVNGSTERDAVISLLSGFGIKAIAQSERCGDYLEIMHGTNRIWDVDIYVDSRDYGMASDILTNSHPEDEDAGDGDAEEQGVEAEAAASNDDEPEERIGWTWRRWLLFLIIAVPAGGAIIFGLVQAVIELAAMSRGG